MREIIKSRMLRIKLTNISLQSRVKIKITNLCGDFLKFKCCSTDVDIVRTFSNLCTNLTVLTVILYHNNIQDGYSYNDNQIYLHLLRSTTYNCALEQWPFTRWILKEWRRKALIVAASPLHLHGDESLGLQDRPDQRVHLTHVATQPEEPAGGARDHQNNLQRGSVRLCQCVRV